MISNMTAGLSASKRTSAQLEVLSSANLALMDETVEEVFGMMLGLEVIADGELPAASQGMVRREQTALVGFAGAMSGICEISICKSGAKVITSAMLGGLAVEDGSDSICDAVGELCNMLAGGWKNRIPLLSAACSLSIPTVIEGTSYQVHRPANARINRRSYQFGDRYVMLLTLLYDPR
jgi:chemotaxis protein CheX